MTDPGHNRHKDQPSYVLYQTLHSYMGARVPRPILKGEPPDDIFGAVKDRFVELDQWLNGAMELELKPRFICDDSQFESTEDMMDRQGKPIKDKAGKTVSVYDTEKGLGKLQIGKHTLAQAHDAGEAEAYFSKDLDVYYFDPSEESDDHPICGEDGGGTELVSRIACKPLMFARNAVLFAWLAPCPLLTTRTHR